MGCQITQEVPCRNSHPLLLFVPLVKGLECRERFLSLITSCAHPCSVAAIYKYVLPVFTERFAAWIEHKVCCSSMISCSDSGGKPFGRKRRNFPVNGSCALLDDPDKRMLWDCFFGAGRAIRLVRYCW